MANAIDNTEQVIDSRDVIERIEELEGLAEIAADPDASEEERAEFDDAARIELEALRNFAGQGEADAEDWQYGETFIHEDYFVEYVKELLSDTGYLPADLPDWIAIDWDETADNVKVDYSEFDFDGVTYYAR